METLWTWLLSGHNLTLAQYGVNALAAFLGAATCAFALNPTVKLPSRKGTELDLGVLRLLLIGTATGVAVGHNPPVPFLVGLVAPVVIPLLLKKTLPALVSKLQPALLALLGSDKQKEDTK